MLPPHHPKAKGEITDAVIRAELMKHGHIVLRPEGDNQRYDFVLDIPTLGFKRFQSKTGKMNKARTTITFATASVTTNTKRTRRTNYQGQIDFFAVYCYENEEVYIIPIAQVPNLSNCSLRVAPLPKTGAGGKRILWAVDFSLMNLVGVEKPLPEEHEGGWTSECCPNCDSDHTPRQETIFAVLEPQPKPAS